MIDGGLWAQHVKPKLGPFGRFKRLENALNERGWPDCYYTIRGAGPNRPASGWLELKRADRPARGATPFTIESLRWEQVEWHEEEHAAGGRVHTLIRVGAGLFVIVDAPTLREIYGKELTLAEVSARARYYSDSFNPSEIVRCLRAAQTITRT